MHRAGNNTPNPPHPAPTGSALGAPRCRPGALHPAPGGGSPQSPSPPPPRQLRSAPRPAPPSGQRPSVSRPAPRLRGRRLRPCVGRLSGWEDGRPSVPRVITALLTDAAPAALPLRIPPLRVSLAAQSPPKPRRTREQPSNPFICVVNVAVGAKETLQYVWRIGDAKENGLFFPHLGTIV